MTKKLAISVLVFVLAFALNSVAQTGLSGVIRGTVLDPTGAAVPGATVTVTNIATGVAFTTSSTSSGLYNAPNLGAGSYRVEVALAGFKRAIQESVRVDVAAVVGLNFTLELGAVAESVEVTAEAPLLKTETTEVGTTLPPIIMTDLPIQLGSTGRAPLSVIFLTPGTTSGGRARPDGSSGNTSNVSSTFSQRINGGQAMGLEMHLDGMSLHTGPGVMQTTVELVSTPESVQEASVSSSTASVETFSASGTVRFITRGGTNEIHGNLYEFWRNDYFEASGHFSPEPPVRRWHEFGFSLGGPIIKDRTFGFVNLNFLKQRDAGGTSTVSIPTAQVKGGDLSSILGDPIAGTPYFANQVFDPATTRDDGQGGFTRDPFPGNIIPADRISAVSRNINGFLATPNRPGDFNNFLEQNNPQRSFYKLILRFDHRINDSHSVFASYQRKPTPQSSQRALPFPHGATVTNDSNQTNQRYAWDYVISPTVTNHLQAGYNDGFDGFFITGHGDGWADILGLGTRGPQGQAPFTGILDGAFPVIQMAPYVNVSAAGGDFGTFTDFIADTFMFQNTLSAIRGKHNMKFGIDVRYVRADQFSQPSNPTYVFENTETGFPGLGSTGYAFGSYLLGAVDNATMFDPSFVGDTSRARSTWLGFYFQDDLKITPKFTMNLGLRWDMFTPMGEAGDSWSTLDLNLANPGADGRPGALIFAGQGAGRTGTSQLLGNEGTEKTNFSPRLGLAYRFAPNTVLRIGYGIHFFGSTYQLGGNMRRSALGFQALPTPFSPDNGLTPAFNWDVVGFPTYLRPPLINPAFSNGSQANNFHDSTTIPYRQEWSFNIQHQLPGSWLIDAGYVGSKGTRLMSGIFNQNQVNPSFLSLGTLLQRNIDDPLVAAAGFGRPYPSFEGSLAQSLRPFPQFSDVGTVDSGVGGGTLDAVPIGNSTYHSFQLKLEKRLTQGFYLLSSYTWSKMITDSDSNWGGFFGHNSRDFFNRQLEKSLSPGDIPHRFVSALMYELPFGPGKLVGGGTTGVTGKVLGGWSINTVVHYQSGNPGAFVTPNLVGLFTRRSVPNVVSGASPLGVTSGFDPGNGDRYYDKSAFTVPDPFTFGNAPGGFGNARHFPFYNENFSLMKRTFITETINIEWRMEFYNVLNRTRFGGSNADVTSAAFGLVGGLGLSPRNGQMGLKINF